MKGYKAFNENLICRDMQYEVGQIYEMEEKPICCRKGFHFCKNIADVYKFYNMSDNTRICEVEALGEIVTDDDVKYCTNKIKIVKEIKSKKIKHCNVDKSTNGFFNSGHYNSGKYNSGHYNSGHCNSGKYNSGHCNSGNFNSGHYNSGNFNSGHYNSGNFNSGHYNSGYCNTTNAKVRMFNCETDMEFSDSRLERFEEIMLRMPHPEYKIIGIKAEANKWKWWNEEVSDEDKEFIKSLPHYDEDVFFESTGIKADMLKEKKNEYMEKDK